MSTLSDVYDNILSTTSEKLFDAVCVDGVIGIGYTAFNFFKTINNNGYKFDDSIFKAIASDLIITGIKIFASTIGFVTRKYVNDLIDYLGYKDSFMKPVVARCYWWIFKG